MIHYRAGWTYDNLNRMVASPSYTYGNDILGNRIGTTPPSLGGAQEAPGTMTWDCLNRLTDTKEPVASSGGGFGVSFSTASVSYAYRADGMRAEKIDHSGEYTAGTIGGPAGGEVNDQYVHYRYDGQMPCETSIIKADNSTEVIDNGLGARGLDYTTILTTPTSGSPTTTVVFPLYDGHGNEVATIQRSGSSYAIANQRSYGAWGEIRQGTATGGPRGRYCGNLGHVQDDETGLVYMRARYYEPASGRFLSEDSDHDGRNWVTYCLSSPLQGADPDGKYMVSFLQFSTWLAELKADCETYVGAKAILAAESALWLTLVSTQVAVTASGNPIGTAESLQKYAFAWLTSSIAATTLPIDGGPEGDAEAEGQEYAVGLQITMWMLSEED